MLLARMTYEDIHIILVRLVSYRTLGVKFVVRTLEFIGQRVEMECFFSQFNILVMINIFKFPGSPLTFNLEFVLVEVIVPLCRRDQLALVPIELELRIIFQLSPLFL